MAKKILIVDDEEDMISMMETRLSANGFEVISASDGLKALAKVKKEKPDMIISDVLMPNMDGFAFCKELKKDPSMAQIPVLILTARGKMVDTFHVMGIDDFLVKPFEANQLLERVNQALHLGPVASVTETQPANVSASAAAPVLAAGSPAGPSPNLKRILVAGSSKVILEAINNYLTERQCLSMTCTDILKAVNQLTLFKPDVLVTEVLIGDKPAKELILKVKNSKELKKIPILAICFVDKEDKSVSVAQRTRDVDVAKNMCLEAGVTECLREFEEQSFRKLLENYL